MKIATWNINSIRIRQPHVIDWLNSNSVDALCLQETKVIDHDFPKSTFEKLGYHIYVYGQKTYNGVAILSRQPLEDVNTGFNPIIKDFSLEEFDEQKRVIAGTLDEVRIVNVYVPNGTSVGSKKYDYKLRWLKVLKQYITKILDKSNHKLCICGDFNIALEDKDIYNYESKENHIMSSPSEREALQDILSLGLKDAFRKFTSEGGYFSWWDYRSGGFQHNRGWRIDHHYLTPKLYKKALSCTIDVEPRKLIRPSDHAPVIVEF
ncbi:exodeoxyribonuclease III [cyanobacterium endosymbiont of Rhopalodia gibberula]|uniref:exodeoxyribonuclease III n=1 Tax=cyanobacterium endosymbiont of Rhopalodia gibberula TaxID=1763363 RepID=UPI000DC6FBF8|nr:exodeoxyribonuclease III [cyanobacterium endosymbiont of Rhopalodia gibberula]BBA79221.1 exodeoxyribonuclease III [cyanobacterium endosymbiont of Rhopalodia gibberula]